MKKSNKEEQDSSLTHRPFAGLKRISTASASRPGRKERPAVSPKTGEAEAAELFLRAVSDVKRLGGPARSVRPAPIKPATDRERAEAEEQKLFLQAMQKIGTKFREEVPKADDEEAKRLSASSRLRQLKKGTIKISEELDLHGYLKDEAMGRLEHFIASAFARGRQAVLVITGKGVNSPDGPVLQGAVSEWLKAKGRGMVAEFHPAPRDKGGSGAFVVFLKSKK